MRARRLIALMLWGAFSAAFIAGCNGLPGIGSSGGGATGGIVAQVTGPSTDGLSLPSGSKASHIPTASQVTTVRVTVSAADISPSIEQDFTPDTVDAEIPDVPAGTDRTVTVEGLNAGGTAIFTGEETGITVVAGQVTDVGTIILSICSAAQTAQAQSLVDDGKSALGSLGASETEVTFGDAMDDIVNKFGDALTLCPLNEEAAFYYGLFQLPAFADSQDTTSFLGSLGIGSVRSELESSSSFDPAEPPIIGGTDANVDLSFADAHGYLFGALPDSLAEGSHLFDRIGSSFSSLMSLTGPDGSTLELEFDYTDAKLLEAMDALQAASAYPGAIWKYTGIDSFISANSTRDPATGEFIDELTPAEVETYYAGSSAPFSLNQTGVNAVNGVLAQAFSALADAIDSLLNNESDDQSNDLFVVSENDPEYDAQAEVNGFFAELVMDSAQSLSASFASSSPTPVVVAVPIGFITDFGTCDPKTGEGTDPEPYNQPEGNPSTTAGLTVSTVTANINDTAGVGPPSASFDGVYYFKFTVDASSGVNLSMFARNTTEPYNYTFGKVSYSEGGTNFTDWDSDYSGSGADGNFGVSVSEDMFDPGLLDPLPQSATLTFLVGVESNGPSPGAFRLYVWDDSVPGVPIFLKGNGRNFTVKVYGVTESLGLGNIFQVMGEIPDLSDRSSLDVQTHSLTLNTVDVEDAILSVVPDATVTITASGGGAVGATMDFIQDHVDVDVPVTRTEVTSQYPGAPSPFCAYPWHFDTSNDFEGGFDL